jgi:tetratricopeptide (TPR) repeat protein
MQNYPPIPFLLLCFFTMPSCANHPARLTPLGTPCPVASARLEETWRALSEAVRTPGGCGQDNGAQCDALRARIERLSVDCPANANVIMANALLAFEARNYARAQQLLDEFAALDGRNPEAAALRARIALEQGNVTFALRQLEQRIDQMGDEPGLRETYASALYVAGRLDEARAQLAAAREFGAPVWRVAYGLGLIEEAAGRFDEARLRYQEALQSKPGWRLAEARLRALSLAGKPK